MEIHPIAEYLNYLINYCYDEDYNPYKFEYYTDAYKYNYTFNEWYFYYRKIWRLKNTKLDKYKLTPYKLIIGSEILFSGYIFI
jgi:hypothetical protein